MSNHSQGARQGLVAVIAATALLAANSAVAQKAADTFPTKPVRILVGFTPGSATDITARLIAPKLSEIWGQPVVIENRSGAGGTLAWAIAAKATPDGHTLHGRVHGVRDQSGASGKKPALRRAEGLSRRHPDRHADRDARRRAFARREVGEGADRAREGKADPLRLDRRRQRHAHGHRALQHGRGHQARARGIQGAARDDRRGRYRTRATSPSSSLGAGMPFIKDGRLVPLAVNTPKRVTPNAGRAVAVRDRPGLRAGRRARADGAGTDADAGRAEDQHGTSRACSRCPT